MLLAVLAVWACGDAQAASVRAWLDRNSMQMGETVTLNVEVSGDSTAAQPDLSALAQDFELLGTQSSTSVNIVNGQTSSKLLWAVGLQPKHEGTFTLPPLRVAGQQTSPLTLTVQAASAGSAGGEVYVETNVEPRSPYVQQQVRLSVKLYYATNLLDGNLTDPQGNDAIVRKLGQDSSYNANVGGRNYHVVERHYAVSAEKSGTLTLPAVSFRGHVVDGNSIDMFFNRGREVGARSQPITLEVRPRPSASGNDAWLPARTLTLSATGIDAATPARAGEPMTLTLHVQAQGLGFEQLPELQLPAIDGVDVYPDKASSQNRDDGEWLFGERERKFAIVPKQAGQLTLPAISLTWWDTAHDRAETATVPPLTLTVQPAAVAAAQPAGATPAQPNALASPAAAVPAGAAVAASDADRDARWWRAIAFVAMALWLLTSGLGGWIWWQRWHSKPPAAAAEPTAGASRKAFTEACARNDIAAAGRALLAWAQQHKPQLRNLGEVAKALRDPAQRSAIEQLERSRYGSVIADDLRANLERVFRDGLAFAEVREARDASALPALYPFRT
jgi:hypothetical protein